MIFEAVMHTIKISFFGNCGSHHCLHNPSNYQKRKFYFKMVFGTVMLAIKIAKKGNSVPKWFLEQLYQPSKIPFFGNCGSIIAYVSHQKFPKKKFLFWKVTASLILSSFLFGNIMQSIKISFFGNSHHPLI